MSAFATALLAELTNSDLDQLAELLRPRLTSNTQAQPWMSVAAAAEHIACPHSRIYALVSARRIPFHKDGSRLLFNRDELDNWVRGGGATRP